VQVWFQNARAKQRRRDLRERQTVGVSDSSSLSERLPDDGQSTAEDEVYWDATTKLAVDLSSTLGAQMEISSSQFFSRVDDINCSVDSVTNLDHNVVINVITTDGDNDLLA
jgi:hypothetical protein